ncbi:E3 ubiquitin-protein ligase RING1-like [Raphanus sativus]|uniref:RING-type E3 ubiquitin transferase n=1 Tax=Raphanus sativus TaxID=3726 RepID=A0A6J0NLM8_RAPSA|nr:E3 ubiquitin-protein ligase RING1-like [Raphanus sativus]KAJ4897788.1 E3 ubiquitin-protein ligase RING1-like [Raphanus sativus]
MSSDGNSTATAVEKMFFCYQCNRTVNISISPTSDPFCPLCSGGFLEEYDEPNPNPPPNLNPGAGGGGFFPMADPFSTLLPLLFGSSSSSNVAPSFFSPQPRSSNAQNNDDEAFDPVSFLQNHLQHLRSSGTHVQFVIENHPSDPSSRVPGNLGDYFFGPGLEQLIQQLAENDPNRYGTPPASKSAVEGLPTVKVTKDMMRSEMNQCAVCMDEFEDGGDVKQMPCKHVFHQDCLMPWLELHNSCPVCRYELPTDDPEYESRGQVQGGQAQGSGDGQGSVETGRRFSIQVPWPVRGHDGDGSEPGSGSGAPGSGSGANLKTRREDLD